MAERQPGETVHFSLPIPQILWMLVILGLVGAGGWMIYPRVEHVFLANPWLNGVIAFVFAIGVLACFWQVVQVTRATRWLSTFASGEPGAATSRPPGPLAPLASLLRDRRGRTELSPTSARSILDSVASRLDEARDITRYIINLLIFLGLLGTFYGLATTVPAVVQTIRSLNIQEGEAGTEIFHRLMSGLESQLGGMGTAFASSLLGLAGSLAVGLLELFAGHAQNRFFRELEDWISSITRVGFGAEGEGSAVTQLLDHMAEQMGELRALVSRSEEGRSALESRLATLSSALSGLISRIETVGAAETDALERIAAGQERIAELLAERHDREEAAPGAGGALDPESRVRLRSLDAQLLRLSEEIAAGRQELMAELRGELGAILRQLRQLGREGSASPAHPRRGVSLPEAGDGS